MAEVAVGDRESFESALRRFMKKVQQDGILAEARQREHYEKPSVKRNAAASKHVRRRRTAFSISVGQDFSPKPPAGGLV